MVDLRSYRPLSIPKIKHFLVSTAFTDMEGKVCGIDMDTFLPITRTALFNVNHVPMGYLI